MSILDIFRINKIKAELAETTQECDRLRNILIETDRMELHEIGKAISDLQRKRQEANDEIDALHASYATKKQTLEQQLAELKQQIADKNSELIILDDEILLQSFGLYKPRYELQTSDQYRVRLDLIRERQSQMVKSGGAAQCPATWTVNDSRKEGERMIRDYTKLIVRSFNNECDASITNLKFNNIQSIEKKITKAYDALNKLAQRMQIAITAAYLNLKLEELYLCYEYQLKKQQEKEEQRRMREQMREEAKLMKEIEEAKLRIEKEEKHFSNALDAISERIQKVETDSEKIALEDERTKLQEEMAKLQKNKLDIQYREQNTRAGYVYVISNIGSFGENVYKIGVTRRLEPQERIDELGDASVPFRYDVHVMIFSDDAPALENALHKAFEQGRLNKINLRREFFRASLQDIESVVKTHFSKPVEFTRLAEASEFRQSLMLMQKAVQESITT